MSATVNVSASGAYDIIIENGIMKKAGEKCKELFDSCKVALITDDKVAPLYLGKVRASFTSAGYETAEFIFKNGETSKNIDTLSATLEFMAQSRITRNDFVVALGGGVVGDMAGFAAGVYLRGIPFVQIPTTLLAMVDSSVGGKTAVDLKAGKNLAGLFYQPSLVLCDSLALETLDDNVFASGMAEVIKYGVIFDKQLFDLVKSGNVKGNIDYIIKRCVELKRDVVQKDEFDNGERQLLNFGHTIGHAIEKCSSFNVSHGEAVAMGMLIASKGTFSFGWSKEDCTQQIYDALKNNSLPTECNYSARQLFDVALNDKKRTGNSINLVVPQEIGHCVLQKVDVDTVLEFIKSGM